jgi:hypothetical protein
MKIEHKTIACELKADTAGDGTFTGYGACFGNVDQGGDMIKQGAFTETLAAWRTKGKMPAMLWQHNTRQPIGVWSNMQEDSHGLLVQGKLTKGVQQADEAYLLLKDGALDGLSIGFETVDAEMMPSQNMRMLNKLNLYEVSTVTMPMNEMACVTSVKAAIDELETLSDAERFLREVCSLSRKDTTDFVSVVKKIARREAGGDQSLRGLLEQIRSTKGALPPIHT